MRVSGSSFILELLESLERKCKLQGSNQLVGLLLDYGANPEAVALWVAKSDLTLMNHPLILKLNMNSFCSNYIIFWWLLMNSIQRRSNPFQLRQRTPRQNLQARMNFFWQLLHHLCDETNFYRYCWGVTLWLQRSNHSRNHYYNTSVWPKIDAIAFNKTLLFLHIKASIFRDLLEEAVKKRGKGFPVLSCSEWIYLS